MRRININHQIDFENLSKSLGFDWNQTKSGSLYFKPNQTYIFDLKQTDHLARVSANLTHMSLDCVDFILNNQSVIDLMHIPLELQNPIRKSWENKDPSVYGRFDFSWNLNRSSEPKLLEYNAIVAANVFETAVLQWVWLEKLKEEKYFDGNIDQSNRLHERLVERYKQIKTDETIFFSALADNTEDMGTTRYLMDCAYQGGNKIHFCTIEQMNRSDTDRLVSDQGDFVNVWSPFYYPEWLVEEGLQSKTLCSTRFIEPLWCNLLHNKGFLAVLWKLFPNHPNLLPTYFESDPAKNNLIEWVRKPLFSYEGANITINSNISKQSTDGHFDETKCVYQEFHPLPKFDQDHALIGSWMVAGDPCALSVRQHTGLITTESSSFVPHVII